MHRSRATFNTIARAAFSPDCSLQVDDILPPITTPQLRSSAKFARYGHFNFPSCVVFWVSILHRRPKPRLCSFHPVGRRRRFALSRCLSKANRTFKLRFPHINPTLVWSSELCIPSNQHRMGFVCIRYQPVIQPTILIYLPQNIRSTSNQYFALFVLYLLFFFISPLPTSLPHS